MDIDAFDLDCQHSHFPASSNKSGQGTLFQILPVDTGRIHCIVNNNCHEMDSLLLRSWAVLLHTYVRHESVCFTFLPSQSPTEVSGRVDDQCVSSQRGEVTIGRYHIGTSSTGGDATFDFKVCAASELRSKRINAGLVFSEIDSFEYQAAEVSKIPFATAHITHIIQHVSVEHFEFRFSLFALRRHRSGETPPSPEFSTSSSGRLPKVVNQGCS